MSERTWQQAWNAQTLSEAHEALVSVRPVAKAAMSVWVNFHLRSAAVYRRVAEADQDHRGHALYWADREKTKADKLTAGTATLAAVPTVRPGKNQRSTAVMPTNLEQAHEVLRTVQPAVAAGSEWWLAYHRHAAAVYAELAEVDRAHHHEALFWAGLERDKAAEIASQVTDCKAGGSRCPLAAARKGGN